MPQGPRSFSKPQRLKRNSLKPQKHSRFKFYILLIRSNKIRFGSIRAVQLWIWEAIHPNFLGLPLFLYILARVLHLWYNVARMPRKKVITGRRFSSQGLIWNFPDQVPGMSNVFQPLGQVHMHGAYQGHVLLALFFKKLSLAIGQKL